MLLGLKVAEVHPNGHGLHFHAVVNVRIPIRLILRISARYGVGRVQVKKVDSGTAEYMAKYLVKSQGDLSLYKGTVRWSTIGGFRGVKIREIEVDSDFHRNKRDIYAGVKVDFLSIRQLYQQTLLHGRLDKRKLVWQKYLRNGKLRNIKTTNTYEQTKNNKVAKRDSERAICAARVVGERRPYRDD